MTDLVTLLSRHGIGGKFRDAVIADRGWRRANHITGDAGEWYERWEDGFAEELNAAVVAWVAIGCPGATKFTLTPPRKAR